MSMSLIVLLIALSNAYHCQVDPNEVSTNYLNETGYQQKYCTEDKVTCPCNGTDCTIDFEDYTERETFNVSGSVHEFITRNYTLTFALNIIDDFIVDQMKVYSNRVQYKLEDGASLTIKNIILEKNGTYDTIVRCNGTCFVKDSMFVLQKEKAVSFISEKSIEGNKTFILDNVKFEIPDVTNKTSHVYSRENVFVSLKDVKFDIQGINDTVKYYYLFYGSMEVGNITAEKNGTKLNTKIVCDGKWLVAYNDDDLNTTIDSLVECIDPTVNEEDETLKEACFITLIVIISLSDAALLIILCTFTVLLLLPLIKRRLGKQGSSEYGILESSQ